MRSCSGGADPRERRVGGEPPVELWDVAVVLGPARRNKRGPKERYNWAAVRHEVFRLMDYRGDFTPDDPEWIQARLDSEVASLMQRTWRREAGETQLRKKPLNS
jgi:hypothetical protein